MIVAVFSWLLLATLLIAAMWHDIAARRIPNALVLCGLIAGLACNVFLPRGSGLFMAEGGGLGLWGGVLGVLAGGALLLPLYALRAMGAGDVKLMAAVGAFFGPQQALGVVLLTFLAGGVLALVVACASSSLQAAFRNLRSMLQNLVAGRWAGVQLSEAQKTGRLPYAIAISCGVALQLCVSRLMAWPFV